MMLLDHLGEARAAVAIEQAVRDVLSDKDFLTPDLGGSAKTAVVAEAVADRVNELTGRASA